MSPATVCMRCAAPRSAALLNSFFIFIFVSFALTVLLSRLKRWGQSLTLVTTPRQRQAEELAWVHLADDKHQAPPQKENVRESHPYQKNRETRSHLTDDELILPVGRHSKLNAASEHPIIQLPAAQVPEQVQGVWKVGVVNELL